MAIELDKNIAIPVLMELLSRCKAEPVNDCEIKKTIDLVLSAKNSLTYRYILFSALLAKSVNSSIDILSLQAKDEVPNAYDARSLCSRVVYPFQKQYLGNVINGSNPDPLVNKPGRYPRLSLDNAVQSGDPKAVLQALCEDLPKISTSGIAKNCLSYLISRILKIKEKRAFEEKQFTETSEHSSIFSIKNLLDELLQQGFGGAALLLVAF